MKRDIKRLWIDFWYERKYENDISYGRHWLKFKTEKLIDIIYFISIIIIIGILLYLKK